MARDPACNAHVHIVCTLASCLANDFHKTDSRTFSIVLLLSVWLMQCWTNKIREEQQCHVTCYKIHIDTYICECISSNNYMPGPHLEQITWAEKWESHEEYIQWGMVWSGWSPYSREWTSGLVRAQSAMGRGVARAAWGWPTWSGVVRANQM